MSPPADIFAYGIRPKPQPCGSLYLGPEFTWPVTCYLDRGHRGKHCDPEMKWHWEDVG